MVLAVLVSVPYDKPLDTAADVLTQSNITVQYCTVQYSTFMYYTLLYCSELIQLVSCALLRKTLDCKYCTTC